MLKLFKTPNSSRKKAQHMPSCRSSLKPHPSREQLAIKYLISKRSLLKAEASVSRVAWLYSAVNYQRVEHSSKIIRAPFGLREAQFKTLCLDACPILLIKQSRKETLLNGANAATNNRMHIFQVSNCQK